MSDKHFKKALEVRPHLKEQEEERQVLLNTRSVLMQKLSLLPENASNQREILGRKIFELNKKLSVFKCEKRDRGKVINDFFRAIASEYFPANVISQILDEANNRANGQPENKVELNLYNKDDVDIIANKHPAALGEIKKLKAKIKSAIEHIQKEMPDLSGFCEPDEYNNKVEKIRILSRIQNLLK